MTRVGIINEDTGDYQLEQKEIEAMLSGRRTSFVWLQHTVGSGFHFRDVDGKMSLTFDESGQAQFNIHLIKHHPPMPVYLYDEDLEGLLNGSKTHVEEKGRIYEYDSELRDLIDYLPDDIIVPDTINGFELTGQQMQDFRLGKMLEFDDGTRVLHKETESTGILSNNGTLILSKRNGSNSSYLEIEEIKPIDHSVQQMEWTTAYQNEMNAMNIYHRSLFRRLNEQPNSQQSSQQTGRKR